MNLVPARDDSAFAELFAGRAAATRRVAYLLCGDWQRAEDLAQTAFVKLYVAWPRLRDGGAAEGFLRRTLLNAYLDDSRRAWPRTPHRRRARARGSRRPVDGRAARACGGAGRGPAAQRACLVLRFFEDCSVEQTAAVLHCSAGTVKSNTARGLDALRHALGGSLDELAPLTKDILR